MGKPKDMEFAFRKNPVLDGFYADPDVLYSNKTKNTISIQRVMVLMVGGLLFQDLLVFRSRSVER
jgi:hypothetical protein